ncbi:D-alanyl-D-alanine carboxypeptidase family protein [Bradyrhizobium tropiciagri]|uniref:D-alanyl-D-alanine carboxypeptidase family protein n=1 Tax=Bradyrhizobium tropiciagri TaxID=312253 RepID=UPI0032DF5723
MIASEPSAQADANGSVPPVTGRASPEALPTTPGEQQPEQPSATAVVESPKTALANIDSVLVLDECFVAEACIDRFLGALYTRAPKTDWIVAYEKKEVTIKRKKKQITVTRSIPKRVENDFGWKDPNAAEKAGMPLMDYVIGGMDRAFKQKLFYMLYAAEQAGLAPGITSGFRDDYRQSIASGLKAANDKSYHGGSSRGGYGHGLAADVISMNGGSKDERATETRKLWKWIDEHEKQFGVGRPYLNGDPAHLGPIDGQEYTSRRLASRHAKQISKRHTRIARHGVTTRAKSKAATKPATTKVSSRL